MGSNTSFEQWLINQITDVLKRNVADVLFLWCDPEQEWLGLLQDAAANAGFELWADPEEPELLLRDRFYVAPPAPRVVWVPRAFEDLTWFKVFALQAEAVWRKSLIQALREYGVTIPREHENALKTLLPAHAREWFDQPKTVWQELTPGTAKGALLDDARMLHALASEPGEFERLRQEERFAIFVRRAVEDFGLPDPTDREESAWRIAATATLLCTEAAAISVREQPGDGDKIIPPGLPRDRALKLLRDWQANVHTIPRFETLVVEADKTIGLAYWARNLSRLPAVCSSRAVEDTLFQQAAERLDHLEDVEQLAHTLAEQLPAYRNRAGGFWGNLASRKVGWAYLVQLAEVASLLVEHADAGQRWRSVPDALTWYQSQGWQLDAVGETLFEEQPDLPGGLHRIRARLRRAYLRAVDRLGQEFSELLAQQPREIFNLPTTGELILQELARSAEPTALVYLDALRLELGYRLADLLNAGEPVRRATVSTAIAPVPSITALGMAFALPLKRDQLLVEIAGEQKGFRVKTLGFEGDLTQADMRRKWLATKFEVKKFLTVAEVLDSDQLAGLRRLPRLLVVHGAEFDQAGHEGQLQLTGPTEHLERYARAIRKLREAGFSRVLVVTDHGYFHWQPEPDEIENTKPTGDVLWLSRRAAVGMALASATAVRLPVLQSHLEALVPRSINAFKTYGGLGFFHGGATLQELLIPMLTIRWPAKATKTSVVLKPVSHITSNVPRLEVEAGLEGRTLFGTDEKQLARRVLVKVRNPETGTLVFRHDTPATVEPGGEAIIVELQLIEPPPALPRGTALVVEVCDADDEEILVHETVILGIDIDEW